MDVRCAVYFVVVHFIFFDLGAQDLRNEFDELQVQIESYEYNQNDSALVLSKKQLSVAQQIGDALLIYQAYFNIGTAYEFGGVFDRAIQNQYLAIETLDSLGNSFDPQKVSEMIAASYHQLAWSLIEYGEEERAIPLFRKALNLRPLNNRSDSLWRAYEYHAIGSHYYIDLGIYDSAVYYLERSIAIRNSIGVDFETLASAEVELAHVLCYMKDLKRANQVLERISAYPPDSISGYIDAYVLFDRGLIDKYSGRPADALSKFDSVSRWLIDSGFEYSEEHRNLLEEAIETAGLNQNFEKQSDYLQRLREIEKTSILADRKKASKLLEIEFETSRKEGQIAEQRKELSATRKQITMLIFFSVTAGIMLFALIHFYVRLKKKNKRIETLMRELHHRVKNNLQVVSSLLGLQSIKLNDEVAKSAVEEGKQRIRAMSLIHQKLYQIENTSTLRLDEYLLELISQLVHIYGLKEEVSIVYEVPKITLDADSALPVGLIVNEIVTNSLKHAKHDSGDLTIAIDLEVHGKEIIVAIGDNGSNVVDMNKVERSTSFGMKLVQILVKQLKGSLEISNEKGLNYTLTFEAI